MTEKGALKKFFRMPRADWKGKIIRKIMSNHSGRELSDVCSVKGNNYIIIVVKRHCEWYSYVNVLIKEVLQNWKVCGHIKDQSLKDMYCMEFNNVRKFQNA